MEPVNCNYCGKLAVVWYDLGFFVVGHELTRPPVCLNHYHHFRSTSAGGYVYAAVSANQNLSFKEEIVKISSKSNNIKITTIPEGEIIIIITGYERMRLREKGKIIDDIYYSNKELTQLCL